VTAWNVICGKHNQARRAHRGAAYISVAKGLALSTTSESSLHGLASLLNSSASLLLSAFLLDLAVGDPRWFPHPVVLMGKFISRGEILLCTGKVWRDLSAEWFSLWP